MNEAVTTFDRVRNLVKAQEAVYSEKFVQYGDDPRSVLWNSRGSQFLRFRHLSELFRYEKGEFSVHEVGCGLGHFIEFAKEQGLHCHYTGSDICSAFVNACVAKYGSERFALQDVAANIETFHPLVKGSDFYIQSGAFNPIGVTPVADWERFVSTVVENMFALCRKGIAFNMLSTYSDAEVRTKDLYYADPRAVYDRCKRLSRFVTLLSDGPLYEFTVLVYRKEYVRTLYPAGEFDKYFVR